MRMLEYNIKHLFAVDIDFDKYPICKNNIVTLHNIFANSITGVIADENDEALAIISVMEYHAGVAGIFIVPSREAHTTKKKTFISSIIYMRGILDEIARKYKFRRVETLAMDDKKHNRWMEYLGFLPEGTKTAYGVNGEDFIMWSKLWV